MKNRKLIAALLAAAICASLAGCADKDNPKGGKNELTESNIESRIEDIFGGGYQNEPNTPADSAASEESVPEVTFEMSSEIKNADFNSGLVQINNDIFQMSGYISVADFVEKYKDRYDIMYTTDGVRLPYDEAGDYLIYSWDYTGEWKYNLLLTPKEGVGKPDTQIKVQLQNRKTSGEEKIPVAEGVITEFNLNDDPTAKCPYWLSQGFTNLYRDYSELETSNTGYKKDSFIKMLEDKGFTIFEGNQYWTSEDLNNRYWSSSDRIDFQVSGETNSFGKKPQYLYRAVIDTNTDKLTLVYIVSIKYVD